MAVYFLYAGIVDVPKKTYPKARCGQKTTGIIQPERLKSRLSNTKGYRMLTMHHRTYSHHFVFLFMNPPSGQISIVDGSPQSTTELYDQLR